MAPRSRQSLRGSDDQSERTRFKSPSLIRLVSNILKLLDHGEVLEATRPKGDTSRKQQLPATYEPGKVSPVLFLKRRVIFILQPIFSSDKRTSAWLKLKKDYVTGLGDTLDVVPIGAWHGNGRKAQWWSPVLLAIRDTSSDRLVAICKCMSGEPGASDTRIRR